MERLTVSLSGKTDTIKLLPSVDSKGMHAFGNVSLCLGDYL